MNCFACKKYLKFTCECMSSKLILCEKHLEQHAREPWNHAPKNLKNKDLILI